MTWAAVLPGGAHLSGAKKKVLRGSEPGHGLVILDMSNQEEIEKTFSEQNLGG